jgi:hypothetical protein
MGCGKTDCRSKVVATHFIFFLLGALNATLTTIGALTPYCEPAIFLASVEIFLVLLYSICTISEP